ncbi:hypothetical protein D9Q98_003006 [Chlorella vulgaris]|uniref:Uncharacterized protein n=1 Tax=Chlorella vulgaris TaxID=3077 RepID=A0A9D4TUJ1_CHLVU|nr:hypothetical protein D9Q98_003006 [Chlorella vulgaris]
MVLRLAGKELDPWTDSKAAQLLAAVGAVLTGDGVTVNGTSARLLHVQASTAADSGKRRRRLAGEAEGSELDSTAAIPSLYTATEVALIQAVLQASYSSSPALIRLVMVDATVSGLLATTMRLKGLSVSQARLLSVYRGSAEPANLTSSAPLTGTEDASPSTDSLTAAGSALDEERASQGLAPWQVAITAASLLGAAAVTGLALWWFGCRGRHAAAERRPPSVGASRCVVKGSPTPVARSHSAASLDLEASHTPRHRQPFKQQGLDQHKGQGAAFNVHVVASSGSGVRLTSGVQLLPRTPAVQPARLSAFSTAAAEGGTVPSVVACEWMPSQPPQVMWEDDSAARVAQVAEQLACSQSRLASYSAANSATVPASLHSTPRKHRPQAAASVPASHGIDAGAGRPEHVKRAAARVQSGSPRRSSSRARGHFAVKDVAGGMARAISRLGRSDKQACDALPQADLT